MIGLKIGNIVFGATRDRIKIREIIFFINYKPTPKPNHPPSTTTTTNPEITQQLNKTTTTTTKHKPRNYPNLASSCTVDHHHNTQNRDGVPIRIQSTKSNVLLNPKSTQKINSSSNSKINGTRIDFGRDVGRRRRKRRKKQRRGRIDGEEAAMARKDQWQGSSAAVGGGEDSLGG